MPRRSRRTCYASPGCARSFGRGRASTAPYTSGCGRTSRSRGRSGASCRGAWISVSAPSPSLAALFEPSRFEPPLFAAGGAGSVIDLLAPGGLALLGLLAPLIVLYILKIRRNRRVVSSTWLWATAQRDLMARSPFKRLILQLPLILQALALIGLALALARPATRGRELTGDHVAIVIDASASMSAAAGPPPPGGGAPSSRIDVARRVAKDLI